MARSLSRVAALAASTIFALSIPSPGRADDEGVVDDVLEILRDRGIVDEAQYGELVIKNRAYRERQRGLADRLAWHGDLRVRHETFWFDEDRAGDESHNRSRGRYRVRLGAEAEVNEWVSAAFRIASGEGVSRSANRSFGSGDDFDFDSVFLDRAYLEFRAPSSWLPLERGRLTASVGKVPNPFRWKVGRDLILWDGDIAPEGASIQLRGEVGGGTEIFLHGGYYMIRENAGAKDPHVLAAQAGFETGVADGVEVGARVSLYQFRSIDDGFLARAAAFGNIEDGVAGDDNEIHVGELGAYLKFGGLDGWPMVLYGHYAQNFEAERSETAPEAGAENRAWGVGVEVGDEKHLAKLGAGYWRIEANAFPGVFVDSNLFDGTTNGAGFTIYGSRRLFGNTHLNLTLFVGDSIENALPAFSQSVVGADRVRLITDVAVRF